MKIVKNRTKLPEKQWEQNLKNLENNKKEIEVCVGLFNTKSITSFTTTSMTWILWAILTKTIISKE